MIKQTPTLLAAMALFLGAGALPAHAQNSAAAASGQTDSSYEAAKKQCDAMSGDQKDACLEQAETNRNTAETRPETDPKSSEAGNGAAATQDGDDYDAAMKKCDALSGGERDKCEADAKTHYGTQGAGEDADHDEENTRKQTQ